MTDTSDDLDSFVDDLIRSGRFASRDDVVRAGLDLLRHQESARSKLDEALDEGLAAAAEGRVFDVKEVFDALEAKIKERLAR